MLTSGGVLKVTDFGQAVLLDKDMKLPFMTGERYWLLLKALHLRLYSIAVDVITANTTYTRQFPQLNAVSDAMRQSLFFRCLLPSLRVQFLSSFTQLCNYDL